VGDDAQKPRWTAKRRKLYDSNFISMGGRLSIDKCFHHPSRSIIAEVVYEHGFPVPTQNVSVIVAPPGGSKGRVTWASQSAASAGDPMAPGRAPFPQVLWRSSPYYYMMRLADRLGLPIAAPASYGGISVPLVPKRSTTYHVSWLRYLSQATVVDLVAGLGLSIGEPSESSYLDKVARSWLKEVVETSRQMPELRLDPILSPYALTDSCEKRLSIEDAYRQALGRVRATEFYFRRSALPSGNAPSIRIAARKFEQKVRKSFHTPVGSYAKTVYSLEEKKQLYFSRSGGFLPDPAHPKAVSSYGMERAGPVRVRYIAPHLRGLG
jgi:hypothetical protein